MHILSNVDVRADKGTYFQARIAFYLASASSYYLYSSKSREQHSSIRKSENASSAHTIFLLFTNNRKIAKFIEKKTINPRMDYFDVCVCDFFFDCITKAGLFISVQRFFVLQVPSKEECSHTILVHNSTDTSINTFYSSLTDTEFLF